MPRCTKLKETFEEVESCELFYEIDKYSKSCDVNPSALIDLRWRMFREQRRTK